MRRLLEGGRFECCIDGDEDFNEEYGMADEGTEWRLKPPADASVPRAHEWVKQEFVRPPVPRAPDGYLDAATAGTTLQLWFDSAWWRATLLGRDQPSEADLAVAEAEAIARATAAAAAGAAAGGEGGGEGAAAARGTAAAAAAPPPLTFSVQLLERGGRAASRASERVRPDGSGATARGSCRRMRARDRRHWRRWRRQWEAARRRRGARQASGLPLRPRREAAAGLLGLRRCVRRGQMREPVFRNAGGRRRCSVQPEGFDWP